MSHELGAIDNFAHDALAAKTNLNTFVNGQIWADAVPQSAVGHYCLYGFQGGQDFQGLGIVRLLTRPLYYAKLVIFGNISSSARTALNELDDAMSKVSATTSEGYVISARRLSPLSYVERDPNNKPIFHRGGLYRLDVSESGA